MTAINSALAARRPLLVRGEPGVGKTQLASAAAAALHRQLVPLTVDSRTESRDLLWHFDSVKRLAESQLCAVLKDDEAARERLDEKHFVRPGPLWWGFDWASAERRSRKAEPGGDSDATSGIPHADAHRQADNWLGRIRKMFPGRKKSE